MSEFEKSLITSLVTVAFLLFEILSYFSLRSEINNTHNTNWNMNKDFNTFTQSEKEKIKKLDVDHNSYITTSPLIRGPTLLAYRVLDLPQFEDIGPDLMPNVDFPSDHVSIGADLKVIW